MSVLEVNVPEELAEQLRPLRDDLPRILELGLRQLRSQGESEYHGTTEVMEFLANLPRPEEILALRPSPAFQARVETLLQKNREAGLSPAEEQEWRHYEFLEHLIRLAKARARLKINAA